jgi:hypothetical protein
MSHEIAPKRSNSTASVFVFVLSIFASAFLIFLVQPMVGKRILPWFGGTAAVWMVCLAFYQTALFLGYAYAHLLIRFASPSLQLMIHASLVGLALIVMPVLPGDSWRPEGVTTPVSDIVTMLSANVAVPFLVLASTGPLVQAWFARLHPTRSPYPLYAVSNGGSLLALLAYPVLLEPRLGLSKTGDLWSVAFGITALLVLICCTLAWRRATDSSPVMTAIDLHDESQPLGGMRVALWLLLSASAVMVLMGVTNRLCRDVASVPFLWILPLAIYLLTLILSFGSERVFQRWLYIGVGLIALTATLGERLWMDWAWAEPLHEILRVSLPMQIVAYGLLLLCVGMLMHGELYRLRPPPHSLTAFYLAVAGGGALGGLFVGLVAPSIFNDYHELAVGLAFAWILIPLTLIYERVNDGVPIGMRWPGALSSLPALVVVIFSLRIAPPQVIHQERTFFGTVHVADLPAASGTNRNLYHGQTLHGVQILGPFGLRTPTAYFGRASPIGLLLDSRKPNEGRRVGVIGLGAGTLASYGRKGDLFRFYEIDPAVVRIASKGGLFRFLESSRAETETVVGDGRLALVHERSENVEQDFEILILDAFSSDSVPVHLLTREALRSYMAALAPDGIIAMHVSNQHLDLMEQVARQGGDSGFGALMLMNDPMPKLRTWQSQWVFLSPAHAPLDEFADRIRDAWNDLGLPESGLALETSLPSDNSSAPVWTDDYSDLVSVVIFQRPDSSAPDDRAEG